MDTIQMESDCRAAHWGVVYENTLDVATDDTGASFPSTYWYAIWSDTWASVASATSEPA